MTNNPEHRLKQIQAVKNLAEWLVDNADRVTGYVFMCERIEENDKEEGIYGWGGSPHLQLGLAERLKRIISDKLEAEDED